MKFEIEKEGKVVDEPNVLKSRVIQLLGFCVAMNAR